MDNQINKTRDADFENIDLPRVLQELHGITAKAGMEKFINPLLDHAKDINDTKKFLAVVGAPGADFMNKLLHTELFAVSVHPADIQTEIRAVPENEIPYCLINGERSALSSNVFKETKGKLQVFIDDKWLRVNNTVVKIGHYPEESVEDETAVFNFFSQTDFVLFITDATAALKRNEVQWMKACTDKNIPFTVGIARLTTVNEDEREAVKEYVLDYMTNHFGHTETADAPQVDIFYNKAEEYLTQPGLAERRFGFFVSWLVHSLLSMRNIILQKQAGINKKLQQIEHLAANEKIMLHHQNDQWIKIENKLVEKRQDIERLLQEHLVKTHSQMTNNLFFELSRSVDAKTAWERDLPFVINREIQVSTERVSGMLQKRIYETVQWLRDEVAKVFNYKMPEESNPAILKDIAAYTPREISFTDSQKKRIHSRYWSAVTAVGAGTLLVSVPIGGIVIATSIVYQALSEQGLVSKIKKEKEKIKPELAKALERIEVLFVNEFSSRLRDCFSEIIFTLKTNQTKWLSDKTRISEAKFSHEINSTDQPDLQTALEQLNALTAQLM